MTNAQGGTPETYNPHPTEPLPSIHGWEDLKELARRAGSHFFDADTMRFFGSRLLGSPQLVEMADDRLTATYVGVTSEYDGFDRVGREYRARVFTLTAHQAIRDDGRTLDMVEFSTDDAEPGDDGHGKRYGTARAAHAAAKRYRLAAKVEGVPS